MALRALARAPSTMWFSYLSREISTNLRACSERVETGMLPKSCCLAIGATFAAELLLRALATSTCGAEVCAQPGYPHNEGRIRRRTRAEKRFIEHTPLIERRRSTILAGSRYRATLATAYWPEVNAMRDGYVC